MPKYVNNSIVCFFYYTIWIVVLDKTLESSLDCKEIKPVNPKGNLLWIFIGRTDADAEAPILWWPDVKSQLIGKSPDAGKDWRQEEKRTAEDEMVGWHHWLMAKSGCLLWPVHSLGKTLLVFALLHSILQGQICLLLQVFLDFLLLHSSPL